MPVDDRGRALLRLARRALETHYGIVPEGDEPVPEPFDAVGGVFATLKIDGELRGCVGYLLDNVDVPALTRRAVVAAATSDPRFGAVAFEELPRIRISISVLTPAEPIEDFERIELGAHGLIVEREGTRGLLLPQVATERNWDRERFLAETCVKAGLPRDSWREPATVVWCYRSLQFDEYSVNSEPET